MNILITGDFFISDDYKNNGLINQSVISLFDEVDYRIVNLEGPITANEPKNKILKTGPHLRMSENTAFQYLNQLKVDAVTLANNHILDYGGQGLFDTIELLKQNHVAHVGAGNNLGEANKPLTLENDGLRIAILNFCENEWSIAEEDKPGANPLDIIDNTNQIKTAKATHDKVICIIHGGHEYYHLPSPRMQKQYRFYADNGADAIVGHHTHCIGGFEIYNDVPIIYSLGNFLFTKTSNNPEWYYGLVVMLRVSQYSPISFDLAHINSSSESFQIFNKKNAEKEAFIGNLNQSITNSEKLKNDWENYTLNRSSGVIKILSPEKLIKNKYIRVLFRKFIFEKYYDNQFLKIIHNQFRCEAHYDLTKNSLKMLNEKN